MSNLPPIVPKPTEPVDEDATYKGQIGVIARDQGDIINVKNSAYGVLGDGTDETTEIQNVANTLTDGDALYFPPGIYKWSALALSGLDHITFFGHNAIILGDEAFAGGYCVTMTNCDYFNMYGFLFNRRNSYDTAVAHNGVNLIDCSYGIIEKNHFGDCNFGAYFRASGEDIYRNQFINNTGGASRLAVDQSNGGDLLVPDVICVVGASIDSFTAHETVVQGNVCGNYRVVLANKCTNINVSNNTSSGSIDSCIYMSTDVSGATIVGNTITESGKDSIKAINGASDVVIANNKLFGFGAVQTTGATGILCEFGSTNITITGNIIRTSDFADKAREQAPIVISGSNVTCTGNTISCDVPNSTYHEKGIKIVSTDAAKPVNNVTVSGNTITNMERYSIWAAIGSDGTIEDLNISGNTCIGWFDSGASVTWHGVALEETATGSLDTVLCHGNHIKNTLSASFYLEGTNKVTITGNTLEGNAATAEVVKTSSTSPITTNLVVMGNVSDGTPTNFYQHLGTVPVLTHINNRMAGALDVNVVSKTATYSIIAAETEQSFDNAGAAGAIEFDLPAALPGMEYAFTRKATQTVTVDPDGTDLFRYKGADGTTPGAAGKNISLDADDTIVKVFCEIAGTWEYALREGTITDEA